MTEPSSPRRSRNGRVRLADVAARAEVSISAVSLALNDRPGISDAVRQHIREIADELGYRSDRIAVSLRTGRSNILGLVIRNVGNPAFAEMTETIERLCAPAGLGVLVASSGFSVDEERAAVHTLLDRGVDLLAVTPVGPVSSIARWGPLNGTPIIVIGGDVHIRIHTSNLDTVWSRGFDVAAAVAQGVEHLTALGHRHVALVSVPIERHPSQSQADTFIGLAERYDIDWEILESTAPTMDATYAVIAPAMARPRARRPTAFLFGSDHTAIAGYLAAREQGLSVPGDVSLVGFGALPTSAFLDPPLTTIDGHSRRLGEAVADLAVAIHGGAEPEPRHQRLDVHLTVAGSTGPAPQ